MRRQTRGGFIVIAPSTPPITTCGPGWLPFIGGNTIRPALKNPAARPRNARVSSPANPRRDERGRRPQNALGNVAQVLRSRSVINAPLRMG